MADSCEEISSKTAHHEHPMQQIAESSQHRLLLKQWMKDENSINRRVALKEARLDRNRKESTQLCCFYFLYHAIILILLYNASARNPQQTCKKAWIPSLMSLVASGVIIWGVRYKMGVEGHEEKLLDREKEDARLLSKCVEELKRTGIGFDLFKEVETLRRAKGLRIESGRGLKWTGRDSVTVFLGVVSGFVLGFTRLVLCG